MAKAPGKTRSMTDRLMAEFRKKREVAGLVLHDGEMLHEDTLHVHFTSLEAAQAIAREGFRLGVPSMEDIGLTKDHIAEEPGFNFAFVADDFPDLWSEEYSREFMVGGSADEEDRIGIVMFRAKAVYTYHWDDLWQSIMWGPEVRLDRVVAFSAVEDEDSLRLVLRDLKTGGKKFEGGLSTALAWADRTIPMTHAKAVSRLPWPDLRERFNSDNARKGVNPYLPLRDHLETVVERSGLDHALRDAGISGDRIWEDVIPGFKTIRWAASGLDGMEVGLDIEMNRAGVSLSIRPLGMGNRHSDAFVVDLPEDFDPAGIADVIGRLRERHEALLGETSSMSI